MSKRNIVYILCGALLAVCLASIFVGSVYVPPGEMAQSQIIISIRLPRILLAVLVGILLSTSGVILQGVLRNPLADPYILGVSAGAGAGAALALAFNWSGIPLFAFLAALIAVLVVYRLSQVASRTSAETLILAGVAVSAFASALLALIILTTGQLQAIYFWLLGSFSLAAYSDVLMLIPYAVVGLLISYFYSKELNALLLGEEVAKTLGVEVDKIRLFMIIVATLMAAAAVSVSGLIGFVGLIVPHFVRLWLGPNYRALVPLSALSGAILLVAADMLARTALNPVEIPIGIVMSLIGAPFFIYLLRRRA
jgi:iron complex transport system permease protein